MTIIIDQLDFHNVAAKVFNPDTGGYRLSRVPMDVREKLNDGAQHMAFATCGVEVRFFMVSDTVTLKFIREPGGENMLKHGIATVYQGDLQASYELSNQIVTTEVSSLVIKKKYLFDTALQGATTGFNPDVVRVILPYDWLHDYIGMEGIVRTPDPATDYPARALVSYGSSITHGGSSTVATNSYVFKLAQHLHLDYYNLGFAGSCRLDEAIADYLCTLPYDVLTLELGVNVLDWAPDFFAEKVATFLKIAAKNPRNRPIYCLGLFKKASDLVHEPVNETFRNILKKGSDLYPVMTYVNGYELLQSWDGISIDGLHPADLGHTEIADSLAKIIRLND